MDTRHWTVCLRILIFFCTWRIYLNLQNICSIFIYIVLFRSTAPCHRLTKCESYHSWVIIFLNVFFGIYTFRYFFYFRWLGRSQLQSFLLLFELLNVSKLIYFNIYLNCSGCPTPNCLCFNILLKNCPNRADQYLKDI